MLQEFYLRSKADRTLLGLSLTHDISDKKAEEKPLSKIKQLNSSKSRAKSVWRRGKSTMGRICVFALRLNRLLKTDDNSGV